ncbi:MAG: hypothetical protein CMI15_06885 [Opitutaceae bacterium]|nr:hypothetical protein [Opitutaceae bacterium]
MRGEGSQLGNCESEDKAVQPSGSSLVKERRKEACGQQGCRDYRDAWRRCVHVVLDGASGETGIGLFEIYVLEDR